MQTYKQGDLISKVKIDDIILPLYSNESSSKISQLKDYDKNNNYLGICFQCVSYVRKYIYAKHNINLASLYSKGDAKDWYENKSTMHLEEVNFQSIETGNIITMSGGPYGHVAIISEIQNDYIFITQQNFFNDKRDINFKISFSDIIEKQDIKDPNNVSYQFESFLRYKA